MECNEYLVPLTLGAIAPYVTAAVFGWVRRPGRPKADSSAPSWYHFPRLRIKH
jgi:hypothetical protein